MKIIAKNTKKSLYELLEIQGYKVKDYVENFAIHMKEKMKGQCLIQNIGSNDIEIYRSKEDNFGVQIKSGNEISIMVKNPKNFFFKTLSGESEIRILFE